jgi:hypothetical protein
MLMQVLNLKEETDSSSPENSFDILKNQPAGTKKHFSQ